MKLSFTVLIAIWTNMYHNINGKMSLFTFAHLNISMKNMHLDFETE